MVLVDSVVRAACSQRGVFWRGGGAQLFGSISTWPLRNSVFGECPMATNAASQSIVASSPEVLSFTTTGGQTTRGD